MSQKNPSTTLDLRGLKTTYSISVLGDQFIRHCYESQLLKKSTMDTRVAHLKQFVDALEASGINDVRDLNLFIIDEYFVQFGKTHAISTTNTGKRIIKVFLGWLSEYKEITIRLRPEAIKLAKEGKKTPKAIADDIIQKVINATDNEQDRLMIIAIREGGMRIDEAVNIKVKDVLNDQIFISTGKGDEERYVLISPGLASKLKTFARENKRYDDDWLFQNVYKGYDKKMKVKTARLRMQKCFMRIADAHMTPHQLRHSMSIGLLREGCDLVTIQHQLGHKDISTTQIYLRVDDDFRRSAYQKAIQRNSLTY